MAGAWTEGAKGQRCREQKGTWNESESWDSESKGGDSENRVGMVRARAETAREETARARAEAGTVRARGHQEEGQQGQGHVASQDKGMMTCQ